MSNHLWFQEYSEMWSFLTKNITLRFNRTFYCLANWLSHAIRQHNLSMVKGTGLNSSLFDRHETCLLPFATIVPFSFILSPFFLLYCIGVDSWWRMMASVELAIRQKSSISHIVTGLIAEVFLVLFLICNTSKNEAKWSLHFSVAWHVNVVCVGLPVSYKKVIFLNLN